MGLLYIYILCKSTLEILQSGIILAKVTSVGCAMVSGGNEVGLPYTGYGIYIYIYIYIYIFKTYEICSTAYLLTYSFLRS